MTNIYQEYETDSWNHNGISYNLNKIFNLAHQKETVFLPIKFFKDVERQSQIEVNGDLVCGSCFRKEIGISKSSVQHNQRVDKTDTNIPIIVLRTLDNKYRVIDGTHRSIKAIRNKLTKIPVKILTDEELEQAFKTISTPR